MPGSSSTIASKTREEHFEHLRQVFDLLEENGLIVNKKKCKLGVDELNFFGHHVSAKGILPMELRVKPILDFPSPTRKDELQRFLGCIMYYGRFLLGIAEVLVPLHAAVGDKTKDKKAVLAWSPRGQEEVGGGGAITPPVSLGRNEDHDRRVGHGGRRPT